MKKVLLIFVLCFLSNVLFAQYSPVSKNIVTTNLLQFFEQPAGFGIAYERMLDKGRSNNVAQFSVKLDLNKISDTDRNAYLTFENQLIYDEDAYQYSGYSITPEVKYYFSWNAPFGPYFSLFVKHSTYHECFKDLADENSNYNSNITVFGRGVATGYQFKIKELIVLDLGLGYMIQDKKSETQVYGDDSFVPMSNEKKDGLRIAVSIGTAF